ncbi:(-)-alpha-pinene synthase-like isoform X1 [Rosa rugosa]|uniref:(-)-alpha-pinene synthase-like isoform X1 n=1 Tax=Rosa rugosa TaxID=74645 RepID=UPI002B4114B4|nr:(-)-alpha-pinene synthase-like isoform X1 [Rosa rugosa]
MSIQVGPTVELQNTMPEIARPMTSFQPGISIDVFIDCHSLDSITHARMQQQIDELKVLVKGEVFASYDVSYQLKLIDEIQRLGVAYHFETEIDEALENIYVKYHDDGDVDLYNVSLRFRLLRQHGYNVSSDIFSKFKDANGYFKESLIVDILAILCLYEATHLRVHGEEILEEALVFTTTHLESAISGVSYPLAAKISQALERPLRRGVERLCARNYIPIYQATTPHNETLLKLAKLDFNLVQSLHKEELSELSRWAKELGFEKNLPSVRLRIVEAFLWMVGMYFEPRYSVGRIIATKLGFLAIILDDIYDACGTFEELKILREAIDRFDVNYCMNGLPRYMQVFYHSLLKTMNEVEEELEKQGISYRVHYAKQVLKDIARDYLVEAQWLHEGCTPCLEEYMHVRVPSVGACLTIVFCLLGMEETITKETFEWILKYPKSVWASSLIFRLMDDIVGSKYKKQKGDVASTIECYIKQYGVSEKETIDVFNKQIVDAWKDMNEDLLRPNVVPMRALKLSVNFARVFDLFYKEEDELTYVGKVAKRSVAALFVDPLPLE